jgi:hypothetical protein
MLSIFCVTSLFSQSKQSISGFVLDGTSREPLIGAVLSVKEQKVGGWTNNSGYFNIAVTSDKVIKLSVSLVGYETKTIEIKENELNKIQRIYIKEKPITSKEVISTAERMEEEEKLYARSISSFDLTAGKIKSLPQLVENDVLRTLMSLPGVTSVTDFSSELFVRGGQGDQNLFLLDGTEIYNLNHLFGFISTFNTDAIKQVNFIKGGFGAEYGGRLSSVVDIINVDGNRNEFTAKIDLNPISMKGTIETPISDLGSISASGRRTVLDDFFKDLLFDNPQALFGSSKYYFFDANLKGTFDLNEYNKISASFFMSKDELYYINPYEERFDETYYWQNRTANLNWQSVIGNKLFTNLFFTYYEYKSLYDYPRFNEINNITDISVKYKTELFISNNLKLKSGIEYKNLDLEITQKQYATYYTDGSGYMVPNRDSTITNNTFSIANASSISLYGSLNWQPTQLIDIEIGVRGNYFSSYKDYYHIEPRLQAKYRLSYESSIKYAFGVYNQYLHRIHRGFIMGLYTLSDKTMKPSNGIHNILGYAYNFANYFSLEFELYYKTFNNLYAHEQLFLMGGAGYSYQINMPNGLPFFYPADIEKYIGNGYSYGLELLLKRDIGPITGYLGYTLSQTKYKFPIFNQGEAFYPRHHRTHSINFALNSELLEVFGVKNKKNKLLLGTNFTYSSDQPFTLPSSVYMRETYNSPTVGNGVYEPTILPTNINDESLPYYMRMDLMLRYEHQFTNLKLSPYLQIYNVGNRKNIYAIDYDVTRYPDEYQINVKNRTMIPIMPSIGVNIEF